MPSLDLPAPRSAFLLRPTERQSGRDSEQTWDLHRRLRATMLCNRLAQARILKIVRAARDLAPPEDLVSAAQGVGRRLRAGKLSTDLVAEAFVYIDAALHQTRGFRFHDVQLRAGLYLSVGYFVEMATGEGKTLTGTLPAALHALAGCATHVVTVNDYLAERDAEEVTPLLNALGLSVGHVVHEMEVAEKRAAYLADITYCANKELVFDYLKDRAKLPEVSALAYRLKMAEGEGPVVSDLDFVLIDEADSVLIDEANIPLILTEPRPDALSVPFLEQAMWLIETVGDEYWEAPDALGYRQLRPDRIGSLVAHLPDPAQEWSSFAMAEEVLTQARTAQDMFQKDVHYIVEKDKIVLVDQQTGRPTADRTLPWGLQQLIELREELEPSATRATIGKLSFQSYFKKYHKIAGMSGTLREVRRELARTYNVPLAVVGTHLPIRRFKDKAELFATSQDKINWAAERALALTNAGRAVLIGVSSVALSEDVSAALKARRLPHGVLNARRLEEEAKLVAAAGQSGRLNVVTNMAGRGTDIKLSDQVRVAGGLHVIILDALETDRLDRQLYGRAGRQGDAGSYDIAHSLDEPALKRVLGRKRLGFVQTLFWGQKELTARLYFLVLNRRRNHLEGVRRKRRLKLLTSEEKRSDLLVFTRRT
jgi:preprotein translocase subunit SecA